MLKSTFKLLSSFIYFLHSYESTSTTHKFGICNLSQPQPQRPLQRSLIDYVAFDTGNTPSLSPIFLSPSTCRSLVASHITSILGSPSAMGPLFSAASSLHSDSTFIFKYFQSYPLAFITSSATSSPTSKGRGPSLSPDDTIRALNNFFFSSSSVLRSLSASSRSYFELKGSNHVWLGDLVETPGSRRRAHFCRTDAASAFTSVIHLSSSSIPLPSSTASSKNGGSLSIVIKTPARQLTTTPKLPTVISKLPTITTKPPIITSKPIPPGWIANNGKQHQQQKKFTPFSFISSRQKNQKKKTKSIRLTNDPRKPIRLILKCDNNEKNLMSAPSPPKIRIKLPISISSEIIKMSEYSSTTDSTSANTDNESVIPRIRLRINKSNEDVSLL